MQKKLAEKLGINDFEYNYIENLLGRAPSEFELYIFSATYSEHCGYKHSKKLINNLYKGDAVHFSENAGGINVGEHTIVFKTESHNHPSAVEPFNGAATGIGGIIRDVLAMNARPIALLNSIRFGLLDNIKNRNLLDGVVSGISSYGNCIGVPNIAGEVGFCECFDMQPIVNVMAVGLVKTAEIKTSCGQIGDKILILGSLTALDGLNGASFASKNLEDNAQNRLSVQIADPFMKKRLIEATLEILKKDGVHACQDCGAAGLLSSTTEICAKTNCGMELFLDKVHSIEGLEPYQYLLSETQERMVFSLKEESVEDVLKIAKKYEIQASVIGQITENPNYKVFFKDEILCDIENKILTTPPFYDLVEKTISKNIPYKNSKFSKEAFINMLKDVNFASKKYIFEQFDSTVQGRTIFSANQADIGAFWLEEEKCAVGFSMKSLPISPSQNPYFEMQKIFLNAYKNLISCGFVPCGLTNCLNFGNPEQEEVASSFVKVINGLDFMARKFNIPVVSGNVSFYNESPSAKIHPTPNISMMGILKDFEDIKNNFFQKGETIAIIGDLQEEELDFSSFLKIVDFIQNKEIKSCLNIDKYGVLGALFKGLYRNNLGFEGSVFDVLPFDSYLNGFLVGVKNPRILKDIPHKIIGKALNSPKIVINREIFYKKNIFKIYEKSIENIMTSSIK